MQSPDPQDFQADADDRAHRTPQRRRRAPTGWIVLLLIALAAAAASWWWFLRSPITMAPAPVAQAPAAPASAPAPVASGPTHPLPQADLPLKAAQIEPALVEWLGAKAVATFLQPSDFPRRVAATIDNLGRAQAPASVWPVQPVTGRFTVEDGPEGTVIAPANAARYAPLVRLADSVDVARAAALYRRMYPLLQQAYRELGFGDRYLNDRAVQVIDLLLATPEPQGPPRVQLLEVKGQFTSERPWVRYQFVDPELESLAAGQKILLRVGPDNRRRLKEKLAQLRKELVAPTQPPDTAAPAR